jgi:predicted secreted protein
MCNGEGTILNEFTLGSTDDETVRSLLFNNAGNMYPFGKLHLQDSGQEFVETVGRVIGN